MVILTCIPLFRDTRFNELAFLCTTLLIIWLLPSITGGQQVISRTFSGPFLVFFRGRGGVGALGGGLVGC